MNRSIVGYRRDDDGEWIAELSCGHGQHVRHRPPFQPREWVTTAEGRNGRLLTPMSCRLCDEAELPPRAQPVRTSPIWDQDTMPAGLRRGHRLAPGTWGRLHVHQGRLSCRLATDPPIAVVLTPEATHALPPDVEHEVEPEGGVRFSIEYFRIDGPLEPNAGLPAFAEGGDPACWAAQLCAECGALPGPSRFHQSGCPAARPGNPQT